MKKFVLPVLACLALASCAPKNYKYVYSSSCTCVTAKNNPVGIEEVSVFPFVSDPDIHEHNAGYYAKTASDTVKKFSLQDFSPKQYTCQPCLTFIPNQKYAFMFKGMGDMGDVTLKFYKDSSGVIHQIK